MRRLLNSYHSNMKCQRIIHSGYGVRDLHRLFLSSSSKRGLFTLPVLTIAQDAYPVANRISANNKIMKAILSALLYMWELHPDKAAPEIADSASTQRAVLLWVQIFTHHKFSVNWSHLSSAKNDMLKGFAKHTHWAPYGTSPLLGNDEVVLEIWYTV